MEKDENTPPAEARATGAAVGTTAAPEVGVNPASFEDLFDGGEDAGTGTKREATGNLDLILDVDVTVTACIGSVRKTIGEVMSLGEGQVIDMERGAGEPVDLLVNGHLVARGEVVVVDERYGIRVSEIMAPPDRAAR